MEEVVADQAGATRRPAKVANRRRRTGGSRASEQVADDTPGAGEGGNGAAADGQRAGDEEDKPDDKYLERMWGPLLARSVLLMWAKAWPFIQPPAWLSRAREAGGGEPELLAARLYESLSKVSAAQEAAIAIELCLFNLKVVSAGRALNAMWRFKVVGLLSSVGALAASVVGAGASGDWHEAAAAALLPLLPAAATAASFVLGKLKELVGELFRG